MKRKILLTLIALCCAAQTWAMVSPDGEQTLPESSEVQMGDRTEPDYLTLTALENNTIIGLNVNGSPNISTLQYSYNGTTWYNITGTTTFKTLQNGQYIKFRSENQVNNNTIFEFFYNYYINGADNCINFTDKGGLYKVSGNINTLINYHDADNAVLGEYSFVFLFGYCTHLADASDVILPAMTLPSYCYISMFNGCTSLAEAPELPATSLGSYCYAGMFMDCASLTVAPELPAYILADGCYCYMFERCTFLVEAPELPATAIRPDCYNSMFSGCTSLVEAPELPALSLREECYRAMFLGCTSLNSATTHAITWHPSWTENWLLGVSTTGDFYNLGGADIPTGGSGIPTGWTELKPNLKTITAVPNDENYGTVSGAGSYLINESCTLTATPNTGYTFVNWTENNVEVSTDAEYSFTVETDRNLVANFIVTPDYLTLTALEYSTGIGLWVEGSPNISTLQYSYDGENWNDITETTMFNSLQTGDFIKFRSENQVDVDYGNRIIFFDNYGESSYKVSGNLNTLTNYKDVDNAVLNEGAFRYLFSGCLGLTDASNLILPATTLADECYYGLFSGCASLTEAPELPATTLAGYCYTNMFSGCTSLTTAPDLPAMELAMGCYMSMFYYCSSLTIAPDLQATTLANYCYMSMFDGCTSLTTAPELPATGLFNGCYSNMFMDCTSLAIAPDLPATTLTDDCYCGMFHGCTSLTGTPTLPAMTLAYRCYCNMFYGCTSLTEAPELPATTLSKECYENMFMECVSLTTVPPVLPATTLYKSCYQRMFTSCISLTEAPELPATTLACDCYYRMFQGCTSLTKAPELPATILEDECYWAMFQGCTSLTEAPELPATTLAEYCYEGMFYGCTSLNEAPELPATTLANRCYRSMFSGCTSLNSVKTHATTWNSSNTEYWLSCVSSTGDFYNLGGADIPTGTNGIPTGWTEHNPNLKTITAVPNDENYGTVTGNGSYLINETCTLSATPNSGYTFVNWTENDIEVSTDAEYSFTVENDRNLVANFIVTPDYLTLTALENNTIIGLDVIGSPNISTLQYSYDGVNWNNITETITFNTLQNGQYIKFRSENQVSNIDSYYGHIYAGCVETNNCIRFTDTDGLYKVSGNINTLINYHDVNNAVLGECAFAWLFEYCYRLIDASELVLPATTLSEACYARMFAFTSLTEAPELPATALAASCYSEMFTNCTSLTTAPELPATTLADWCYGGMFFFCESLTEAPELPATTLTEGCYTAMFRDCKLLTEAPALPATTLTPECYFDMFSGCSSLTEAPVLSSTTLAANCYSQMFSECASLETAPELPATTLTTGCYNGMFSGCTSLKIAPELPATTLALACYSGMFGFCESLTEAPELPATTLTEQCYSWMFAYCTLLGEAPELPATSLATSCYLAMFYGCSSLNSVTTHATTWDTDNAGGWLYGVAANGDFYDLGSAYIPIGESGIPEGWTVHNPNLKTISALPNDGNFGTVSGAGSYFMYDFCLLTATPNPGYTFVNWTENDIEVSTDAEYSFTVESDRNLVANFDVNADYLTFTALENNTIIGLDVIGSPNISTLQYSYDGKNWNNITGTTMFNTLQTGEYIKFRSENQVSNSYDNYIRFKDNMMSGAYIVSGNINTLINYLDVDNAVIGVDAFIYLFISCSHLTNATSLSLPATTLAWGCYMEMFGHCTSLTEAPELPATTLPGNCYCGMFFGCTSLTEAPELPATTLDVFCYSDMFRDCISLTEAPELPATTLAYQCYENMFLGCTSLNSVTTQATTWNTSYAKNWLSGVSSTGDFYNLGGADIPTGTNGIPTGWTEHNPNLKTITAVPNDENYGTVTGNGSYLINETCTLTATPNSGYTFVNWTENDEIVSTDAEYSFTVENDRNLVANFEASSSGNHWNPNPYLYAENMNVVAEIYIDNVLQTSSDIEIGAFCDEEVRGSGRVEYEGVPFNKYIVNLTIHGVADDNITFRVFNHQTDEEVSCRIGQSLTFTPNQIEGNLINPYAIECFTTADIVTTVNPSVGGTVSGDGTYQVGQTVTLTATASDYYRFVNWTENDEEVSTSESYSFTAYDDRSLVANFEIYSHWLPDPSLYTYSMTIITEIQVDGMTRTSGILRIGGREQDYNEIEVGAFCGDEIRGSAMLTYMPEPIDKFMVSIVVYGEENDNIAFRLYNHETATEYNLNAPEPIPFVPNATLGSFDEPYVLNFLSTVNISASANPVEAGTITGIGDYAIGSEATLTVAPNDGFAFKNWTINGVVVSTETSYSFTADDDGVLVANFDYLQSKELAAGWNWYSTYVAVSGTEGFNMLTANLGTTADVIKSQTNMSMYYDEYNVWGGTLTTIDNMQMYMIKMNTTNELEIVGGLADLAGTQLTLHPGWNWISFPSNVETSLTDALAGFTPDDGDCIKSQFNMALFYGGEYNVWNGSLNKLTPGQGFMYKNNSSSIKVLTYSAAGSKNITDVNITTDGNYWQPNIHAYPDNMNITAVVLVNGTEQASENMEVGVFSGGECRGSGRLVYNEMAGRYVTYLTVYGNDGDNLSFRLYDASKDEEYQDAADCSLTFEPNLILGDLFNPFAINFGYDVVSQDDMASFSVYPNPAKVNSVIRLGENCDDVKVINSLGVVVKEYTNTDRIEGFDLAGIYYLVITKGNSIVYSKIIVE